MQIDPTIQPSELKPRLERLFEFAAAKSLALTESWDASRGTPVTTVDGKYAARGWTEWTEGFQYGCLLLAYEATSHGPLLELARERIRTRMPAHVTHTGVHDHGFNNLST